MKSIRLYRFLILALTLVALPSFTSSSQSFYQEAKRGWFWCEEKKITQEESRINANGVELLLEFQEQMEEAKAQMIMNPSIENTAKYIQYQNEMFLKSDLVSKSWQATLLERPHLNIVRDTPISQTGMNITRSVETLRNEKLLQEFAKTFKLLFFYKSNCPYCQKFALVLEYFSKKYGIAVAAVTLDGKSLEIFPATLNPALVRKLNVEFTPSVFAFSDLGIVVPIAQGFLPADLLERNVLFIIEQIAEMNRRSK